MNSFLKVHGAASYDGVGSIFDHPMSREGHRKTRMLSLSGSGRPDLEDLLRG